MNGDGIYRLEGHTMLLMDVFISLALVFSICSLLVFGYFGILSAISKAKGGEDS